MHRIAFLLIALPVAVGLVGLGQSASDAELLRQIDEARFLNTEFVSETMQFLSIDGSGDSQSASVVVSYQTVEEDAPFRVRLDFLSPEESAGQAYLILEDESVMLCTPDLEMPLIISGGTDLFGDSTISTTAGIQFDGDYEIHSRGADELGGEEVLRLELRGLVDGLAYPTATVWVHPTSFVPLQTELDSFSGEPISRITYDEYTELAGDAYALTQTIDNLLLDGFRTILTITQIDTAPLDDGALDPDTFCRPNES